jgi:uncharacterized phage protein (TIGR01671 family)
MREIKFRAWDKKRKRMIYDYDKNLGILLDGTLINVFNELPFKKEDIELMQFTGLKDKKGKDIYEGDIVVNWWINGDRKVDEGRGVVEMRDGIYGYQSIHSNFFYKIGTYLEVIGNMYENKELLKETK